MNAMRWWLLSTVIWAAGMLALSSVSEVPWWDADPLLSSLPETSLTPGQVLLFCSVALCAGAGLLLIAWRRGELGRCAALVLLATAVGGLGVVLHGVLLVPLAARGGSYPVRGEVESLVVGATWVTGMLCGFAIATMRPRERVLRVVLGVFVLLGTLMVAKAAFERFVELPRTIALFETDTETILIANGIEPGSSQAAIYERRLRSQQPTAWFGLANVLGSFLAALTVLLAVSSIAAARDARVSHCSTGAAGVVGLLLLGPAITIWLTGSLGAIGIALLVMLALAVLFRMQSIGDAAARFPGSLALTVGGLVLLGIVVRGLLIPEALERSVLFRWHYLVGTSRVFLENLLTGAGPAGFQGAYTRLKPPISPENVQSPHVLIADWVGSYGLLGCVVVGGILYWLWCAQQNEPPVHEDSEAQATQLRSEFAWCLLVTASIVFTAFGVQWGVIGGVPDLLLVMAIALGFGAAGLFVLLRVWQRHPGVPRWAAMGIAAVLIGHGMFDVAPARTNSAMLFWLLVGVGVGPLRSAIARKRWQVLPLAIAVIPLAGVTAWVGGVHAFVVEPEIAEASDATRQRQYELGAVQPIQVASIASPGIADMLYRADHSTPSGWLKFDMVRFRFAAQLAAIQVDGYDARSAARDLELRWPGSVEAQAAIATTLWAFRDDPRQGDLIREAASMAAIRAALLAPHDPIPAYRAAFYLYENRQLDQAKVWAERAVQNQQVARLDPLVGLDEEQIEHVKQILTQSGSGQTRGRSED